MTERCVLSLNPQIECENSWHIFFSEFSDPTSAPQDFSEQPGWLETRPNSIYLDLHSGSSGSLCFSSFTKTEKCKTTLTHGLQNGCGLQSNSVQQSALHCKHQLFIGALLSLKMKKKNLCSPISCVRKCGLNVNSEWKKKLESS